MSKQPNTEHYKVELCVGGVAIVQLFKVKKEEIPNLIPILMERTEMTQSYGIIRIRRIHKTLIEK